jgi:hypothetical protein
MVSKVAVYLRVRGNLVLVLPAVLKVVLEEIGKRRPNRHLLSLVARHYP